MRVQRAILSCYDKTGLIEFARLLAEYEVELISTSGTLSVLREAGIPVVSISDYTGMPEMMSGRVKSLHPAVHAGLLGIRENKLHQEQLQAHGFQWIDMVVVNLQPVAELIARHSAAADEVIDQIDIGGVAMLRSAAKNYRYVTAVVNPERYPQIIHEMRAHDGVVSFPTRFSLAREAFAWTARYDQEIAEYLEGIDIR